MQVIEHLNAIRFNQRDGVNRREFEYIRHGTSTLLAAFNIGTGAVYGRIRRRTAEGLVRLMDEIAALHPSGDVYVVWDNLNIHHGPPWQAFNARHGGRFHFVHTHLHASWVNQVEIWLGLPTRAALKNASLPAGAILPLPSGRISPPGIMSPIRSGGRFEANSARIDYSRSPEGRMPKRTLGAEDHHADELKEGLASHGFKHLRVRHYGETLTIESGAKGADAFPHARLRRETVHLWRLEMPTSTGAWESTPVRDETDNLIQILISVFPWALAKPPSITARTSGRKH